MKRWYIVYGANFWLVDPIMQHLKLTKGVQRISSANRFYCKREPRVITFNCDYSTAQIIAQWLPEQLKIYLHWQDAEYPHQIAKR